jgi:hypothetical protein
MEKNKKLTLEGVFLDNLADVVNGNMDYDLSDVGTGKLFKKQLSAPLKKPMSVKPPLRNPNNTFAKSTGRFAQFDLTQSKGFAGYSQICQKFINSRNPNAGINGSMMANSAKKTFLSTGKYVPPELALAQLAMEGGLSTNPNATPVRTNNPYNVGNWDSGRQTPFPNKQVGIDRYYDTIAKDYLTGNRTPEDILRNFTNSQGKRYASAGNYEQLLNSIVNSINRMKQSMSTT